MHKMSWSPVLLGAGLVIALMGLGLAGGGIWLIQLGGSWYYLLAGLGFLVTAYCLVTARPMALWVFAFVVAGTLIWALWEVGLDWWPLGARGGIVFLVGLFLLTPWVRRALRVKPQDMAVRDIPVRVSALRGAGLALSTILGLSLVVAVASWFTDHRTIAGSAPEARAQVPSDTQGVSPGEWHAYGRTAYGQRYSPLNQITPANVASLQVAWTYRTGDIRGRPGDPVETTFQVTPLKIGNRLILCTPHQDVIALDATTGRQIWRYEPQVRGELALQHLTCRGVSYYSGTGPVAAAPSAPAAPQVAQVQPVPDLPVAATGSTQTAQDCSAKLFMPTADGRLIAIKTVPYVRASVAARGRSIYGVTCRT
jgi:quinoprotein glucose dehydrogenase